MEVIPISNKDQFSAICKSTKNLGTEVNDIHAFPIDYTYKIRPHHGLCLFFFKGKGYSSDFVKNMSNIKKELEKNPLVCVTSQTDIICNKCPNNMVGTCNTENKVAQYDSQVLLRCSLSDGDTIPFHTFRNLILHNIILPGKREEICGNCQWTLLCHDPDKQD